MVGADHLVAERHIGARSEEQGTEIAEMVAEPVVAVGHHLDVLGGDAVGFGEHFLIAVANDHLAEIGP